MKLLLPIGSIKSEITHMSLCLFKILAINVEPVLPEETINIGFCFIYIS